MQPQLGGRTLALIKLADRLCIRNVLGFFPSTKNIRIEVLYIFGELFFKVTILAKYLNERKFFSIKSSKSMIVDP